MLDYQFVQDPFTKQWIILSPRRAIRPDQAHEVIKVCPFCIGMESHEPELYRVGGEIGDTKWLVRVLANKYPFAPSHELIIHSPDHHKSFDELPLQHVETILGVYQNRYLAHQKEGSVYIFYNHGIEAGQSQPHPHTQLVVMPPNVSPQITQRGDGRTMEAYNTSFFSIFSPVASQWPDEVWIAPQKRNMTFGEVTTDELHDLAFVLQRIITLLDMRHGSEFPYNFYIYPGSDWYLRIIPRYKSLGGFEIGTQIYVNTQDPLETISFIKEHFESPDKKVIQEKARASYRRGV